MKNHLKNELHDIISGKVQVRFGAIIQTISSYLKDGFEASSKTEDAKQVRDQETKKLEKFILVNGLCDTYVTKSKNKMNLEVYPNKVFERLALSISFFYH